MLLQNKVAQSQVNDTSNRVASLPALLESDDPSDKDEASTQDWIDLLHVLGQKGSRSPTEDWKTAKIRDFEALFDKRAPQKKPEDETAKTTTQPLTLFQLMIFLGTLIFFIWFVSSLAYHSYMYSLPLPVASHLYCGFVTNLCI